MAAENNNNTVDNSTTEFWNFVESLKFDSNQKSAETVRQSLLKQLSPHVAEKYKDLCDTLAYSLYRTITDKNMPIYLYASYEAIAKGQSFYNDCLKNGTLIESLSEKIQSLNHFGNCFPTEDDYYSSYTTNSNYRVDDYDNLDDYID